MKIQDNTIKYNTIQHSTVQHSIAPKSSKLHFTTTNSNANTKGHAGTSTNTSANTNPAQYNTKQYSTNAM